MQSISVLKLLRDVSMNTNEENGRERTRIETVIVNGIIVNNYSALVLLFGDDENEEESTMSYVCRHLPSVPPAMRHRSTCVLAREYIFPRSPMRSRFTRPAGRYFEIAEPLSNPRTSAGSPRLIERDRRKRESARIDLPVVS